MAQYTGKDIDVDRLREVVEEELLTDKIMNWLAEHSTVELVPEGSLAAADNNPEDEVDATDAEEDVPVETSQTDTPAAE